MQSKLQIDHTLSKRDENIHSDWNNGRDPALVVDSGDVIRVECREPLNDQIIPESDVEDLLAVDMDRVHALTGPISVDQAVTETYSRSNHRKSTTKGGDGPGSSPEKPKSVSCQDDSPNPICSSGSCETAPAAL